MAYYAGATKFVKIAIFMILIAIVLSIVGIATDYWVTYQGGNAGLYNICLPTLGCVTYDSLHYHYNIHLNEETGAVLALHIVALVALVLALILIAAYFCLDPFESNDRLIQISLFLVVVACLLLNIASIVYGATVGDAVTDPEYSIGWSFILAACAGIIAIIAAILLLSDQCCFRQAWKGDDAHVDSKHSHNKRGTWAERSQRGRPMGDPPKRSTRDYADAFSKGNNSNPTKRNNWDIANNAPDGPPPRNNWNNARRVFAVTNLQKGSGQF